MLKKILLTLLLVNIVQAQSPNSTLTQKGGKHNAIFLNPAKLSSLSKDEKLHATFTDIALVVDKQSYDFLKALDDISSSTNKNQEISELLNKNIGNTISISANNFSSIYQKNNNISWSLGIANSLDAYFIPHSGFGSKGAMESSMEKYQMIVGTLAMQQENFHYGLNLKSIKKTKKNYNYSIRDMINNDSLKDYFNNEQSNSENTIALDTGIVYKVLDSKLNHTINLAVLDIRNRLTNEVGEVPTTTNIGTSLEPYNNTILEINYLDLFEKEINHKLEDSLRIHLSKSYFNNTLKINTGLLYNSLLYGFDYQYSLFNIGLHSYKLKDYSGKKERKYEINLALTW